VYCHECGTGNTVDSKYCKECGIKINDGYRTMMLSVLDLPVNQSDERVTRLTRLLDMAFWHNQAGNYDAAITAAEAALGINANSTTAHSLLGTLYEKRGDDEAAIRHFEAVLALNPNSPADAAKLDQLRRGVHVKATAPPVYHLWLPPGLFRLSPTVPLRPLLAACVAVILVMLSGMLLLRPWSNVEGSSAPTMPVNPPPPVSVNQSAFASGSETSPAVSAPMVLTAAPALARVEPAPRYLVPTAQTGPDPFAAGADYALPRNQRPSYSDVDSLPVVPRLSSAERRRLAHRQLPNLPLRLSALPGIQSNEITPAPVTLPDGISVGNFANLPLHTVVVDSLPPSPSTSAATSPVPGQGSHIRITVRQAAPSDTDAVASSTGDGGSDETVRADAYQQRALSLQQGGDFGQARAVYQLAIRAYQGQIASGRDVETAQRGLAACQTGLQICQQSQ